MEIINETKKPIMSFEKIRNGTVFTCNDEAYIKGNNCYATNLKTGDVLQPEKESDAYWSKCTIHNRASLKLF